MIRIGMAESMPEDIADEMAVLIRKAPTDRQGFGLRCSAFGLAASDKLPRQDEGQERRGKRTKNKVTMPARGGVASNQRFTGRTEIAHNQMTPQMPAFYTCKLRLKLYLYLEKFPAASTHIWRAMMLNPDK